MAKVKCRYCNKRIEKENAYSPLARKYYCSVEEYNKSMSDRDYLHKIKLLLNDLFGYTIINTFVNKRISDLSKNYSYKDIYDTIDSLFLDLDFCIQENDFKDENHKINYIFVVIKNRIKDETDKNKIAVPEFSVPQEQPNIQTVNKYKRKNKRVLVSEIILNNLAED